jgi:hypothetical protein
MNLPAGEANRERPAPSAGTGWTWPRIVRDNLQEGDRLLICKHYWENLQRGGRLHYITGGRMTRDDGSSGLVKFTLFCEACRNTTPPRERDYHEWVWIDGKVWLADSIGTPDGPPVPADASDPAQAASPEAKK